MALFRSTRLSARLSALTIAVSSVAGCLSRPIEPIDPHSTTTVQEKLAQSRIDKIDLLLMIDNSASMSDKQSILADAVPDLVKGLVTPLCVDDEGVAVTDQPASPLAKCPAKSEWEFEPVLDIHIGIISSSLGSYGTGTCPVAENASQDDRAHLLDRKDEANPADPDNKVSTYQNRGFLAWDPAQALTPPGTKDVGDPQSTSGLVPTLRDMVKGVGQSGCGYEAQLESWYRFLVDPEPYQTISLGTAGKAAKEGIDEELLAQRRDFLRPDSLVAVIMLTDENDCSFKEGGDIRVGDGTRSAADKDFKLPRARHECAVNPDDACCKSCGAPRGDCPEDPTCLEVLSEVDNDGANVRCFNQKKRFGVNFLYPLDRYTQAIQSDKVLNRAGELVQNPLYPTAKESQNANPRTPKSGLVFVAGIVGVPWQDIARRDANGKPDLLSGLDQKNRPVGGFKSAKELSLRDASGGSTWEQILGDPAANVPPKDPLMIESRKPRDGITSATGDSIAPMDAASATENSINGHEWDTTKVEGGDLQYACIFKLPTEQPTCDTGNPEAKNPLCQDESGQYTTKQYRAKAYPGLRELGVLQGLGDQGIVASVCPAQLENLDRKDYGYRPAIGTIIDQLKQKFGDPCLPRSLTPDVESGQVDCLILEAQKLEPGQTCSCEGTGFEARQPVEKAHAAAEQQARADEVTKVAGLNCFCEVKQLTGDALNACQNDTQRTPLTSGGEPVDGWCYIDATLEHPVGNASLVSTCASTEQRKIRFVGKGKQRDESTRFITCSGE